MALIQFLLLSSLIIDYTSAVRATPRRGDNRVCKPITAPLCKGALKYNTSSFPNALGHKKPDDAGLELHQFFPLVKVQCSPYLKEFLCVFYYPACDQTNGITLPCRQLCQAARDGCQTLMNKFGFQWPESLNCEGLPDDTSVLCYNVEITTKYTTPTPTPTPAPKQCSSPVDAHGHGMCGHLTYNITSFPNMFGHMDSDEAAAGLVSTVRELLKQRCEKSVMDFLCVLHFPPCSQEGSVPPCKQLCLQAKSLCHLDENEDFLWPAKLNCDLFPALGISRCIIRYDELILPTSVPTRRDLITTTRAPPVPRRKRITFRKFLAMFQKSLGQIQRDISSLYSLLTDK